MKTTLQSISLCFVALLAGCTSTQHGRSRVHDEDPSLVTIRVCRGHDNAFAEVERVTDNGRRIGHLARNGELEWQRPAGEMTLVVKSVAYGGLLWQTRQPYTRRVNAGEKYTFRIAYREPSLLALEHVRPSRTRIQDSYAVQALTPLRVDTSSPIPPLSVAKRASVTGTGPIKERWALVIGISDYSDPRIDDLPCAARDATAFGKWLQSPSGGRYKGSHVRILLNGRATASAIRESLFEWLSQPIEEDLITIFFAGHGSPQSPDNDQNLFLLPHDADYDKLAASAFPMWDIHTAINRFIHAKRIVVIADACHSGGIGREFSIARRAGRGIKVAPVFTALAGLSKVAPGICVLSASDANQLSREGKEWGGGHGVFTYFLLRGLSGAADQNGDKAVTVGEIVQYLSEQVRRATRCAQSPKVSGDYDPAMTIGK